MILVASNMFFFIVSIVKRSSIRLNFGGNQNKLAILIKMTEKIKKILALHNDQQIFELTEKVFQN